jgi:hypothetical protein
VRASSFILFLLLCASAMPQAFGRFGYRAELDLPGVLVTKESFRAKHPAASNFTFAKPASAWKPAELTDKGQIVTLNQYVGSPSKIKCDLFAPGFSLYFPLGIDLGVQSQEAPFLSWDSGSVAEEVPTPSCSWILVSFHSEQPPVLLVFPEEASALVTSGQPGAWRIRSSQKFAGWVRVLLPFGTEGIAATTAPTLGVLASRISDDADVWLTPPPRLIETITESDEESVTATWRFSAPGALIPTGAVLAGLGGYPLKILTETRRIDAATEGGPITVSTEPEIRMLFPSKRIPTGRYLGLGSPVQPTEVSADEYAKATQLALLNLSSSRSQELERQGRQALASYLENAPTFIEPWTNQRLFSDESGAAIDQTAAYALLMQALTATNSPNSDANSLLTTVEWRTDWYTWQIWTPDRAVGRRAAALAAIAAALCSETPRRFQGALLQAGLSAERGLGIWKRLRGNYSEPLPKHVETLEGLRRVLFLLETPLPYDPMGQALLSEIRFYGDMPITLQEREGKKFLTWFTLTGKPGKLTFASGYPISFGATANLASIEAESNYGVTEVAFTPKDAGVCELELIVPSWARTLPSAAVVPHFVEAVR